jgi:uncharacterized protein (TIRG00374 family)
MAGIFGAGRHLWLAVAVGLLIFGGWSFWGELNRAAAGLATFRWVLLVPVLALSVLNYCLRALRWEYYLRLLGVRLPLLKSVAVFFASLLFCITPGRLGEVCKSYFVTKIDGATPVARTVPVVLAERLQDLLATALLASAGLFTMSWGWPVVAVTFALVAGLLLFVGSRRLAQGFFARLARLPRLSPMVPHLLSLYEGSYTLLRPTPLAVAAVLSLPAWFTECLGCYLVLAGLGAEVPLLATTFAYTVATLIGALSMLPGGLGATEGSLTVFLVGLGVDTPTALAATFLTRACTLWFAVGLGGLVLLLCHRELCGGKRLAEVMAEAKQAKGQVSP